MISDTDEPVTEKVIREKLESSGELGKMRAMVIDAALKSLSDDETTAQKLFLPLPLLNTTKESKEGRQAFLIIMDYLKHLGLTYTLSVLKLEASLEGDILNEKDNILPNLNSSENNEPILTKIIQMVGNDSLPNTEDNDKLKKVTSTTTTTTTSSATTIPPTSIVNIPASSKKEEIGEDSTYFISKWNNKVFYRFGGQVSGQQIQLEYLNNCTVYVLDPLDSITVDDCEGGELVIAACEGSLFLRNCKNMIVHVACKQLRTRDCENIEFHIFASTDPVIEASHHMIFKPFNLRLPGLKNSFKVARLDPKANRFVHVYDFTEDDKNIPNPHYSVIFPNHGLQMINRCKEKGLPECPQEIEDLLEGRIIPASSSESGKNKSYDIKTGAHKWNEAAPNLNDHTEAKPTNLTNITSSNFAAANTLLPSSTLVGTRPPLGGLGAISGISNTNTSSSSSSPAASRLNPIPAVAAAAAPTTTTTRVAADEGSEGSYSSFDDDEDESDDPDDALDVEEDSDDF